ncbi:putative transposase [Caloramator quimbayensis]|uniref:Putative transposase n=1 Tax=Caloramator quimbayensis TaxID=1147123 RepID=A0A1T4XIF7_9CLOT|nr:putative transposase [Caloramator quimbayensis]
MESLNTCGMLKNRKLSKSVQEQAFYEFKRQMEYKCELSGIKFILADRFYPSSKTCSRCGSIKDNLSLSERVFVCDKCGYVIDRDLNASINLKNYGKSIA